MPNPEVAKIFSFYSLLIWSHLILTNLQDDGQQEILNVKHYESFSYMYNSPIPQFLDY